MVGAWINYDPEALPPPDAILISSDERIETPIDDRGLIDISQLIADIKATVDPDYKWLKKPDVHHFYWPRLFYPFAEEDQAVNLRKFRNLPVHKGYMPR